MQSAYELLLDLGPEPASQTSLPELPAGNTNDAQRQRRRTSLSSMGRGPEVPSIAVRKVQANSRQLPPPNPQARQKDKFVPLPTGLAAGETDDGSSDAEHGPDAVAILPPAPDKSRISVYCLAESFERPALDKLVKESYPHEIVTVYNDVVHLTLGPADGKAPQDAFFFNFGVLITFGLDKLQEGLLMSQVATKVQQQPYPASEREVDEFHFQYSTTEQPHIKNDIFVINKRSAKTHTVRLAIAYALAQSSKLSVYEEQVWDLVEDTKHLPTILAKSGRVAVAPKDVAKLIGRVFLQNANVNLLSSVLDTPAFFWSSPDHLQALYERACEYLELEARVEVLNTRFQVLQEMLDMLRDQQNNFHESRLEMIIIWLLVVDAVLMFSQLLSLFGVIGSY